MRLSSFSSLRFFPLFAFVLAYFLYAAWPAISGEYVANNDASQHLIWLFDVKWGEPFYPATSGAIQPWGYAFLCRCWSLFASPYTISNWGPLLSLFLTAFFVFKTLRGAFPYAIALGGAILVGHFAYPPSVGFFSRAFCVPALAFFACYWVNRSTFGVVAALLFSALFYPPALLIALGVIGIQLPFLYWTAGLSMSFGVLQSSKADERSKDKHWYKRVKLGNQQQTFSLPTLLIGALLSFTIIFAKSQSLKADPWIGPFVDRQEILTAPEYTYNGRVNFVHELKTTTPSMFRYSLDHHLKWPFGVWFYYLAGGVWLVLVGYTFLRSYSNSDLNPLRPNSETSRSTAGAITEGKGELDRLKGQACSNSNSNSDFLLLSFFLSASILHFLAQKLVPLLFIPDRFLSYPMALFAGLFMIRLIAAVPKIWTKRIPAILLPLLLLAYCYHNRPIYQKSLDNYSYLEPVYTAIEQLPEGSLIAAPPAVSDQIAYFSQRSTLISNESAHALYFTGYRDFIDRRWRDFIRAYTAAPDETLLLWQFLEKYRITHLLVDRINLGKGDYFTFEPYFGELKARSAGKTADDYLLLNLPAGKGVEISERYLLLSIADLAL